VRAVMSTFIGKGGPRPQMFPPSEGFPRGTPPKNSKGAVWIRSVAKLASGENKTSFQVHSSTLSKRIEG